MSLILAVENGRGLPKNRVLRARLRPHLDADPELLAALLVHLQLARDDVVANSRCTAEPDGDAAASHPSDNDPT